MALDCGVDGYVVELAEDCEASEGATLDLRSTEGSKE